MNDPAVPTKTHSNKHLKHLLWIPLLGILQFLICCIVAATFYPGGSPVSPEHGSYQKGYLFWQNPISDLGRIVAWNGEPNSDARRIYLPSQIVLVLSVIPLAFLILKSTRGGRKWLTVCSFFLATSIGFMFGVALTPYDILLFEHDVFFHAWLIAFVLLLTTFLLAQGTLIRKRGWKEAHPKLALLAMLTLVLLVIHVSQPFLTKDMQIYIATQKWIALGCLGWLVCLSIQIRRRLATPLDSPNPLPLSIGQLVLPPASGFILALVTVGVLMRLSQLAPPYSNQQVPPLKNISTRIVLHGDRTATDEQCDEIGRISGALMPGEELVVEVWVRESGKLSMISTSSQSDGPRLIGIPFGKKVIAAIPIVLVQLDDFEQVTLDSIPDSPEVLELFHPPLRFRKKISAWSNDLLKRNEQQVIYSTSEKMITFQTIQFNSLQDESGEDALFVTARIATNED